MYPIKLENDLIIQKEKDRVNAKILERRLVIAPVIAQMVWLDDMNELKGVSEFQINYLLEF
jgi:hypothetical protein